MQRVVINFCLANLWEGGSRYDCVFFVCVCTGWGWGCPLVPPALPCWVFTWPRSIAKSPQGGLLRPSRKPLTKHNYHFNKGVVGTLFEFHYLKSNGKKNLFVTAIVNKGQIGSSPNQKSKRNEEIEKKNLKRGKKIRKIWCRKELDTEEFQMPH